MKICRYHQIEFDIDTCPLCTIEDDEKELQAKFFSSPTEISEKFDLSGSNKPSQVL